MAKLLDEALADADQTEIVTCPILRPTGPYELSTALPKVLALPPDSRAVANIFRERNKTVTVLGINEINELARRWGLVDQ
jgi:hypothetical protein